MNELSVASWVSLYVLVALLALYFLILWGWQFQVLRGKAMKNVDGTVDDWHEQKILYGMAFGDVFLACPVAIAGVVLTLLRSRWGFYILALESFFFIWVNIAFTVTSLRFEKPKPSFNWFITYPFGIILGLAYVAWTVIHFDRIYLP
jgi:hypothetical protein